MADLPRPSVLDKIDAASSRLSEASQLGRFLYDNGRRVAGLIGEKAEAALVEEIQATVKDVAALLAEVDFASDRNAEDKQRVADDETRARDAAATLTGFP